MKRLAALLLCGALMLPLTTGAQGAQQQQAQEASGVSRGQAAQMLYEAQGSPAARQVFFSRQTPEHRANFQISEDP